MKKQNLVIVGGGSTYTLGLIMSLIEVKEQFPLNKLTLYDKDADRQEQIGKAAAVIIKERYPEILKTFTYTTSKEEAFTDIDVAFVQIRTGGLTMRELDEQIPLDYNAIGQETCGAGGMAYGIRSIKDMIELVHDIRSYAADAWILNYTNPAAIVSYALKQEFPDDNKILNICDMPIDIMLSYADHLGLDVWDLVPEYFGLNHFGWFTKIYDKSGNDHTNELKEKIANEGFVPIDKKNANDQSWQKTFNQANQMFRDIPEFLPNTYLQYYLYPNEVLTNETAENTRARQVINGREKDVAKMCEQIISQQSLHQVDLEAGIHGIHMVKTAASLLYNLQEVFIVMVENNGIISNIPDEAIVEVPAVLTSHGPKPFSVGTIPTFYKGLIENQFAYEKLVVEAYYENSYLKALQALTLNRTIIDVSKAKAVLGKLMEANKEYWPVLK